MEEEYKIITVQGLTESELRADFENQLNELILVYGLEE